MPGMFAAPGIPLSKSVFTPEYAVFAARLVELRRTAGLTQAELAIRLRRPQSYVSKYERGERRLDIVEFIDVARALGADAPAFVAELEGLPRPTTDDRPQAKRQNRKASEDRS